MAQGQDVVLKRNGDEINAKVLEIMPDTIKYKRTDNPDGPIISILKSEVFMIKDANGTKELMSTEMATTTSPEIPETMYARGRADVRKYYSGSFYLYSVRLSLFRMTM